MTFGKGNRLRARTAELIRDDLAKVGIKVNLEQIDFEKLKWNLNFNSGFECAILLGSPNGIEPYLDSLRSSDSMHLFTSIPPTDWEKKIDALLIKQLGTMDSAIQKKQWDEIQLIMAEQSRQSKFHSVLSAYRQLQVRGCTMPFESLDAFNLLSLFAK